MSSRRPVGTWSAPACDLITWCPRLVGDAVDGRGRGRADADAATRRVDGDDDGTRRDDDDDDDDDGRPALGVAETPSGDGDDDDDDGGVGERWRRRRGTGRSMRRGTTVRDVRRDVGVRARDGGDRAVRRIDHSDGGVGDSRDDDRRPSGAVRAVQR